RRTRAPPRPRPLPSRMPDRHERMRESPLHFDTPVGTDQCNTTVLCSRVTRATVQPAQQTGCSEVWWDSTPLRLHEPHTRTSVDGPLRQPVLVAAPFPCEQANRAES